MCSTASGKWRDILKKIGAYKIWQILYPIGMYYVISSMAYFVLGICFGSAPETYMLRQLICSAVTLPFLLSCYRQDKHISDVVYGSLQYEKKSAVDGHVLWNMVYAVLMGALLGMAVNNLLAMTPLMELSAGFLEANDSFFAGGVVCELLGSCLVIPIAEELLYRGIVYKRLRLLFDAMPAIVLSALLFGLMHVNLVQFLYAGLIGLFLAYLTESGGRLYLPILAHIAANLAAVVRQETGWLSFAYEPTAAGIGISAVFLAAAAGLFFCHKKWSDAS